MSDMSRADHLAWCKRRALDYVDRGDLGGAVASMTSDLRKHPGTNNPAVNALAMVGMFETGRGASAVRRWIEGFN